MKVKDLINICKNTKIKLYSGYNGSFISISGKNLSKYNEVEILSIDAKINVSSNGGFATPCLCVFGNAAQIREVKNI